jgi:anaerobic magnesium-protoporphyrin IX monomethyl ester cyclase
MRILFVHPNRSNEEATIHLGLGYLAAYLKMRVPDLEVEVLDTRVAGRFRRLLLTNPRGYDMVAITATSRFFREAAEIAAALKRSSPETPVVLGGAHASLMWESAAENSPFDFAVIGEGEETLWELFNYLRYGSSGGAPSLDAIDGLIYKEGNEIRRNRPRRLIEDLDSLPFPLYQAFPMSRYSEHMLLTSRSCPYACVFCASAEIWGRTWRARSPENIVREIRHVTGRFGHKKFLIIDDSFNIDIARAEAICDEIAASRTPVVWASQGFRIDRVTPGLARKMREAGCLGVGVGIESGDPEVVRRIGKHQTLEEIRSGVACLKAAGLSVYGQFMIGNPGDTLESIKASMAFARELRLDRVYFYAAVPYPKTALWQYVKEHGRFLVPEDPSRFDDLDPKVIFETPEFPYRDRLEAIALVREAGFQSYREKVRSRNLRGVWGRWAAEPFLIHTLFKLLGPRRGRGAFLGLQRLKRTLAVKRRERALTLSPRHTEKEERS